jgi:hypothetical protein
MRYTQAVDVLRVYRINAAFVVFSMDNGVMELLTKTYLFTFWRGTELLLQDTDFFFR